MDKRIEIIEKYLSKEKNLKKIIDKELKEYSGDRDEMRDMILENFKKFEPDSAMLDDFEDFIRGSEEQDEENDDNNQEVVWDKNTVKDFISSLVKNQLKMLDSMLKTKQRFKELEKKEKELKEELFRTETQLKEYIDLASRLKKDYENLSKRTEKEKAELEENASMKVCNTVVEIMDNFELVLKDLQKKEGEKVDREGVLSDLMKVEKKFQSILEKEGVKEIESVGAEFDHNFHEAIACEESDEIDVDELVAEEFRKGYMFKDRLMRPALVKVLKKVENKKKK
ncbi:MAG: nucleotide exchange factor GrpE [Candidatus Muiribacteriaceae bacterium]